MTKIAVIFIWVTSVLLICIFLFRSLYNTFINKPGESKEKEKRIAEKMNVTLLFTLSDEKGNIIDKKHEKEPFTFLYGGGQILAGLERQLTGLTTGVKRKFTVMPHEAYGTTNTADIVELNKSSIPENTMELGALIKEVGESKKTGKIIEIKDETVIIDYNHPLAGKKLIFDVDIINIEEANGKEIVKKNTQDTIDDNEISSSKPKIKEEPKVIKIETGMKVTLSLNEILPENHVSVDENQTKTIEYVHGTEDSFKQVIPGLQERLIGLTANEETEIIVPAEEAYGEVDPEALLEIDKGEIFAENLEVGLVLKDIGLEKKSAKITRITESTVELDFNHPLAGKPITYRIKVLDIKNSKGEKNE